jgi:hypothetical protein
MFPSRPLLTPNELRLDSLEESKARFCALRDYAIAATERLGELYAELDPENDADDAVRIAELEIDVGAAFDRYCQALKRVGWEAAEIIKLTTPPSLT